MTDYTDTIYLYQKIDGYNPPNQYKLITRTSDVEELLTVGDNDYSCKGKYAINGSLASVDIITTEDYNGNTNIRTDYSIVCVQADGIKEFFIGNIVKREILSPTSVRFIFNIDWYTSQFCTAYFYASGKVVPTASAYMERRASRGKRFMYLDDGFKPITKRVTITKSPLFMGGYIQQLLVYNEPTTNTIHWVIRENVKVTSDNVYNAPISAKKMWMYYQDVHFRSGTASVTPYEFNPKNVLFFGYFPISIGYIPFYDSKLSSWDESPDLIPSHMGYAWLNYVDSYSNPEDHSNDKFLFASPVVKVEEKTINFGEFTSTDMDEYTLRDVDGTVLFNFPKGVEFKSDMKVDCWVNPDTNTPSITYRFKDLSNFDTPSFTIVAHEWTYLVDAEQVYNAEQRVYNQEMRSFTNLNQLVSGLRGSVTEGAMMYAFSRNSGPTKGMIGGGVSASATVFNYTYTELYANKRQTEIEDKNAKVQSDTLLWSTKVNCGATVNAGVWCVSYDTDTKSFIDAYHSLYGYVSNYVGNNIALNDTNIMSGYIQADIILAGGLRKEIEDYISKMFSYGITFSNVS